MAEQWNKAFQNQAAYLRGDKWTLEMDNSIEPDRPQLEWHQYIRNGFAHFDCLICDHSWASNRVQVVFHFTRNSSLHHGTVKIRSFKQRCRDCFYAQMEEPSFSQGNIDVMVEKLIEKIKVKCYGEKPPEANRNFSLYRSNDKPHESDLCEACQRGICRQSNF